VFNEGIVGKRFIKLSMYGGKLLKRIDNERNEQADLLRKEAMSSIDGL
jgi:hypothetical protein